MLSIDVSNRSLWKLLGCQECLSFYFNGHIAGAARLLLCAYMYLHGRCKPTHTMQVREAFGNLSVREGWDKLPRYALGASSGASMVRDAFANKFGLACLTICRHPADTGACAAPMPGCTQHVSCW